MSAKTKKLVIQEGKKDYGEEAVEYAKETLQGDNESDGGDEELEEARAEDITFDKERAEESAARAHSQKARSMDRYKTGTSNDPEEEEEEENPEGNLKQPKTNPIRGSRGWEKQSAARARSEKRGIMAGYATGILNKPEEGEEEEYAAEICKKNGKEPCRGKSRLGIC